MHGLFSFQRKLNFGYKIWLCIVCPGDTVVPRKGKSHGLKIFHRFHFSSALKRMAVIAGHTPPGSTDVDYIAAVKGAPETLRTMVCKAYICGSSIVSGVTLENFLITFFLGSQKDWADTVIIIINSRLLSESSKPFTGWNYCCLGNLLSKYTAAKFFCK